MSNDELQPLSALLRLTENTSSATKFTAKLRRSPRKHAPINARVDEQHALGTIPELSASSKQRRSPLKESIPKKITQRSIQAKEPKVVLVDIPELSSISRKASDFSRRKDSSTEIASRKAAKVCKDGTIGIAGLLSQSSTRRPTHHNDSISDKENTTFRKSSRKVEATSAMSKITQTARENAKKVNRSSKVAVCQPKRSNPYILREAHCEDLNESSGTDGEDSETDLSGFIVDDDATLSFDGSAIEISSDESERETRRERIQKQEKAPQANSRRRLIRGRKKTNPHSDTEDDTAGLSTALNEIKLEEKTLEQDKSTSRRRMIEVVDLTSSPASEHTCSLSLSSKDSIVESQESTRPEADPLSLSMANLILQPSSKSQLQLVLSKFEPKPAISARRPKLPIDRPTTPPTTPPRDQKRPQSPTKLKSPSKLFSPSKRALEAPRSPVRQSLDAFWDHNVINEWTDIFSPKKTVLGSPRRKILVDSFRIHEDDDSLSDSDNSKSNTGGSDDSYDSLPPPCDSPSKERPVSPSKFAALRADTVKRKELKAARLKFDCEKEKLALDLLIALDSNITGSKISALSASTGGIKIIWSKTLRSTAGRANWKRSVTKASGSPVKGDAKMIDSGSYPGVLVQHYASIELADKIIDREERLVNTLAHEFCHLANFMISNIRDQPHGSSFQQWGRQVASFLRSSAAKRIDGYRFSWNRCEVTTKHSYVVEYKYLFVCIGRPKEKRTMAEKFLDLDDEEGCGAEYGRHSKSIDVDKQRCGRCKGLLVQVKPTPRATSTSPRKQSPRKKNVGQVTVTAVDDIEKMIASVNLSD